MNNLFSTGDKIIDSTENTLNAKSDNLREEHSESDNKSNKEVDEGNKISALNDQNNAAIQSIINANSANTESTQKEEKSSTVETTNSNTELKNVNCIEKISEDVDIEIIDPPILPQKPKITSIKNLPKTHRWSRRKDVKPVKKVIPANPQPSETMITEKLVVCSQKEPGCFLAVQPACKLIAFKNFKVSQLFRMSSEP